MLSGLPSSRVGFWDKIPGLWLKTRARATNLKFRAEAKRMGSPTFCTMLLYYIVPTPWRTGCLAPGQSI